MKVYEYIKKHLSPIKWKLIKWKIDQEHFYFEIHLVDHCNLNCASCAHFSPIANEWYIDVEDLRADLSRMAKIFGKQYSFKFCLMGGEPLLHPEINEILKISRKCLPKAQIQLITNGLLLEHMSEDFWLSLKNNAIELYLSRYPINFDYLKYKTFAESKGITVVWEDHTDKVYFGELPINRTGKYDGKETFSACFHANEKHNLYKGRLYTCMFTANVRILNEKFNLDLPTDTGIDIYSVKYPFQIRKFLRKPTKLCGHCALQKNKLFKWRLSKSSIDEWIEG